MVPLPAQRHPIFFRPRCLRLIQRLLKTYEPKIGGMQVFWDTVYFLFHDPYWASVLTLSCYNLVTEAPVVESPLEPASQISRWSWILVEILKLGLVKILNFMKFYQDLCLNLWYVHSLFLNPESVRISWVLALKNVPVEKFTFHQFLCNNGKKVLKRC